MTVPVSLASRNADGDHRDWSEIRCRATQVVDQLASDHDPDSGPDDPGTEPGSRAD